jgi:hypothetical protein
MSDKLEATCKAHCVKGSLMGTKRSIAGKVLFVVARAVAMALAISIRWNDHRRIGMKEAGAR